MRRPSTIAELHRLQLVPNVDQNRENTANSSAAQDADRAPHDEAADEADDTAADVFPTIPPQSPIRSGTPMAMEALIRLIHSARKELILMWKFIDISVS